MAGSIVRGNAITLDGFYIDSAGAPADPPDPQVSIVDAEGVTVVSLDTPTNVAVGHFQYVYPVAADALLGAWAARWYGTVDGFALTDEDGFTVVREDATTPAGTGEGTTCAPWATHEDAPLALQAYDIDPDAVDDAFQVASDVLFELTGRRWPGVCTDVIRPQASWRFTEGPPRWWPATARAGLGSAYGWCSCHRGRETGCNRVPEIKLPGHPVDPTGIVVKIDGLEFFDFRLDDGRFLVRTDGDGWPCCQNLLEPDTEENTWSVAYSYGTGPDLGGKRAAVLLGTALFGESNPEAAARCKIDKRATRVTRAGTTVELGDPVAMVEAGLTGIGSVDLWVASKRLGQARRRATVLVPGKYRSVRRVGT